MARKILHTLKMDEEITNKLEALNYEVNSRKEIIAFMLGSDYVNSDAFVKYQDEYQKFFIEYQTAKQVLEDTYVRPLLEDGQTVTWNLDFTTGELTIYE